MISNIVSLLFDADAFAEKLKTAFQQSLFKTQADLISAVKSNKATISRLMNASKQYLTDKPSQPKRDLVLRFAKVFNEDKNEWLIAGGYAPTQTRPKHELIKGVFVEFDEAVPQKIREQLLEGFKTVAYGVRARTADIEPNVRVYEGNDIKYIDPTGLPKVNEHERPDRLKKTG